MTNYVNINPSQQQGDAEGTRSSFAALIKVKSSRYVERTYQDPALASKVAIKWEMLTTKGNTFDRMWTTGIPWDGGKNVSPDGRKLTTKIGANSDASYLLKKAVAANFPSDKIVDDISVFEGETFFMTEDQNPKSRGSYKGLYPKEYHPEGWDAALAAALARRAAREAQQNAPTYTPSTEATLQSSYTPPAITASGSVRGDVIKTAAEALVSILLANGSTVTRGQLPAKLGAYATGKGWDQNFQKSITVALWEMDSLKAVVNSNPSLKIEGETVSFK